MRGVAGRVPARPADGAATRRGARPRAAARHRSPRILVGRDTRESGDWIEAELAHGACRRRRGRDERRRRADAGGRVPDARAGLRRRRRDLGVAQSVRGQRHQGVLRTRREVHRARRARSRGDRRGHVVERATRASRERCRAPISSALISIICARSSPKRRARAVSSSPSIARTARRRRWRRSCSAASASTPSSSAIEPDGRNINLDCGSTHPELLARTVVERGCRLGVAFDGDGDRAIFVDQRGEVVNGDAVLLMCGRQLQARRAAQRQRHRRHRDEQHRPRDRAAGARHRARPHARWATST